MINDYINFLNSTAFLNDETNTLFRDNVEELFKKSESLVNRFGFNNRGLVDDILKDAHLRCIFLHISLFWIKWHSSEENRVWMDGRNEIAMRQIRHIAAMSELNEKSNPPALLGRME